MKMEDKTIYQFKTTDLAGNTFDFSSLKGKKMMIVNTASQCGLTPQFEGLEAIHKEYQSKGFTIIGFPSNDFAGQEPGTNEEIATFCERNYRVTFPMMSKVTVKGEGICEVYQFLTKKEKNGVVDSTVEWNFQKYLINENGEVEKVISPQTSPTDPEITDWIKS
ncbi:glutathione peroxidase [Flavobacterium frigidarium]|uniref:glutathione peroxidase n=1 Tax=Flavobacterium frigidarium TaxID=99286 RepID=UPI001FE1D215|nr:glutathione peroxidase [Flavobacterium frigidarium]